MEKSFFIDGNIVVLRSLEELVSPLNSEKTIKNFLKEKNLLGYEHYLVSPPLLISVLYGTFLLYKEQFQENQKIIDEINKKMLQRFNIIRNDNNYKLHRAIRNALAHYRVDIVERGNEVIVVFEDSADGETHFIAEISLLSLRLLIEELSSII